MVRCAGWRNQASDAADGYLAKRFGWHTELGTYLDPIADKALLVAAPFSLPSHWQSNAAAPAQGDVRPSPRAGTFHEELSPTACLYDQGKFARRVKTVSR